jgi:hypothetical protein
MDRPAHSREWYGLDDEGTARPHALNGVKEMGPLSERILHVGSAGHTVEKSARSREQCLFLPCILGAQVISETVAEADSPEHVQIGIRHKTKLLIRTHVLNVCRQ